MAIVNFEFPGVTLTQEFTEAITTGTSTLSVACIGMQYKVHRVDYDAEDIKLPQDSVSYSATTGLTVSGIPGRTLNGIIDTNKKTQTLVIKDAVFTYAEIENGTLTGGLIDCKKTLKDGLNHVADVLFGSRGVKVGDPVVLSDTGGTKTVITEIIGIYEAGDIGYSGIAVADLGELTDGTVKINFGCYQNIGLLAGADTFEINPDANQVVVKGKIQAPIGEKSGVMGTLQAGEMYVEYREQVFDYVGKLGSVSSISEVSQILGPVNVDNPLALAVYFAVAGGSTVFFTGVSDETVDAYTTAAEYLEKFTYIYSIVPTTEDEDIIRALLTSVVTASEDPESKIKRTLWFGATVNEIVKATGTATFEMADGENSQTNSITLTEGSLIGADISAGDKVLDIATGVEYTILTSDYKSKVTVSEQLTDRSGVKVSFIKTHPVQSDIVDAVVAKRYVSSYRAQCVWADGVLFNGQLIDNYAIAAAAAGMRAFEPCQRPLSNLPYNFFTVMDRHGLTKTSLKSIASNGIWIIDNNNNDVPVNMRQLTTAASNNINIDEESIVANADEIAISMSTVGESLVGCSNISPTLISVLQSLITANMDKRLVNTTGNDYVGPQLLSWNLEALYQDTVNLDWVYARFDCEPPKPFNRFNMTMRVL